MRIAYTTFVTVLLSFLTVTGTQAQTTAMDFNCTDCSGNWHHLFADLDAGNAVILEFFMTNCTPCVTAGNHLEAMKADLLAEFPGQIKAYSIGFTNSYNCTSINNWVTNNGFTTVAMDSGATQVAYYGGMGMPTIVVLGGTSHDILGAPYVGFTPSDTAVMAYDIRQFLGTPTAVDPGTVSGTQVHLFPNPASDRIHLQLDSQVEGELQVQVMDLTGRHVASLAHEMVPAGPIQKTFSTSALPGGSYLLRVSLAGQASTHKITVAH
jgi:hypothetical protein